MSDRALISSVFSLLALLYCVGRGVERLNLVLSSSFCFFFFYFVFGSSSSSVVNEATIPFLWLRERPIECAAPKENLFIAAPKRPRHSIFAPRSRSLHLERMAAEFSSVSPFKQGKKTGKKRQNLKKKRRHSRPVLHLSHSHAFLWVGRGGALARSRVSFEYLFERVCFIFCFFFTSVTD